MKLASQSDRLHAAGAEVIAISVDDDERQAAMFARWPTPNVLYVSDRDQGRIFGLEVGILGKKHVLAP